MKSFKEEMEEFKLNHANTQFMARYDKIEDDIRNVILRHSNFYMFDLNSSDIGGSLWWKYPATERAKMVWSKFIRLGYKPKIMNCMGDFGPDIGIYIKI